MSAHDAANAARLQELVAVSLLRLGTNTSAARVYKALGGDRRQTIDAARVAAALGDSDERVRQARLQAVRAITAASGVADLLPITDPRYPERLRHIPDPPVVLWVTGAADALQGALVAVIGSRYPTSAGLMVARHLSTELARAGLTVVSGLARGIDAAAHQGALDAGGRTVAVLGNGLDIVYPSENRRLAAGVRGAGAMVTEFPPGTPPHARHFPLRNRIISGLSQAVVVVEASERSGTLITARAALDQGRDVLAVPGSVLSGRYRGCHALIKDGARLVETVDDILEELGRPRPLRPAVSAGDKPLLPKYLEDALPVGDPVAVDELAAATGRAAAECLRDLALLEVAGAVVRIPGGGYVRVDGPATYIEGQAARERKETGTLHAEGSRRRRIAREGEDD
jgi:DNA processing protein